MSITLTPPIAFSVEEHIAPEAPLDPYRGCLRILDKTNGIAKVFFRGFDIDGQPIFSIKIDEKNVVYYGSCAPLLYVNSALFILQYTDSGFLIIYEKGKEEDAPSFFLCTTRSSYQDIEEGKECYFGRKIKHISHAN